MKINFFGYEVDIDWFEMFIFIVTITEFGLILRAFT